MVKKNKIRIVVSVVLSLLVMIVFHEGFHIISNEFRVDGFCFLDCNPMREAGLLGNGYTPFGVYLSEPINLIAKSEVLAHGVGFASALITFSILMRNEKLQGKI